MNKLNINVFCCCNENEILPLMLSKNNSSTKINLLLLSPSGVDVDDYLSQTEPNTTTLFHFKSLRNG